ncbi:MAG: BrnA antitoxin family protein [Burkholderiaceae bacterium]|nr:BrnA antitoxin family protein [Burkholderiaceae bacterium]
MSGNGVRQCRRGCRRKGAVFLRADQGSPLKISTTIRFDADVLAAFKATGDGWQTRMNDVLKEWLRSR